MLVSALAKRILVFGDSFVYGKESGRNARLPADVRFTGVLQMLLGDGFDVIEEGLRGRMIEGENSFFPNRDGLAQFNSIIGSHLPIDLVVIMLGTNDCNNGSTKTPKQIAQNLKKYPAVISDWCEFLDVPQPKLLIIAPPAINADHYDEASKKIFGPDAPSKILKLPDLYKQVTRELGAGFFDASKVCSPASGDGIHLDAEANHKLAAALADKVKELLA